MKSILFLFLFVLPLFLQAQPDLSPKAVQSVLGKLISIARNPASDGDELLDTITGGSGYGSYRFISAVQYPGASPAIIRKDENIWRGNTVSVQYTWDCQLMSSKNKSASNFITEELKLINSINQILPGNFPDSATHSWKLNDGISISIYRGGQNGIPDDRLGIYFTVKKNVLANKQENIDRILLRYNSLVDNVSTGNLLQAYGRAAFFKVLIETKNPAEAAAIMNPLLKKIADKDMLQAFNILMELPGNAPVATLTAAFTPQQKQLIKDYAQGVITAFNNKQNGVTASTRAAYKPSATYNIKQLYKDVAAGKYFYIKGFDMGTLKYSIIECWWAADRNGHQRMNYGSNEQLVDMNFLQSKNWRAISAGDCHTCAGSGICISSTPYSYSITEKGIYNKYEISGSGYRTKKVTCWSCGGSGALEYFLQ